jgi:hypothetical protein
MRTHQGESGMLVALFHKYRSAEEFRMSDKDEKTSLPPMLTISDRIQRMFASVRAACEQDPDMCDAAAMVYIGDIYSLRDDLQLQTTVGRRNKRQRG